MKNIYTVSLLFLCSSLSTLVAQNISDALRYSILDQGGTARVIGAGGAFGAMGGDIGVIGTNVSGIADFRKNEVTVSVSYNNPRTTSTYLGEEVGSSTDGRNVQINNVAFVINNSPDNGSFVTSNFMVGFQQYANFGETYSYDAVHRGSLVESLANNASAGFYSPFSEELADLTGAIYFFNDTLGYVHDFTEITFDSTTNIAIGRDNSVNELVQKEEVIERSGNINELQFAWAGRLKSGLRVGIGIGMPWISYEENKFYEENDTDGDPAGFNKLNFNQSFTTSGIGFNIKAGIGYSIMKKVRLGLNVQSPTFYRLDDNFYNSMLYDCSECIEPFQLVESDPGAFAYKLRTPMKLTASVGTLMGKDKLRGFLNLDLNYIDYGSNRYNFTYRSDLIEDAEFETFQNNLISNTLASGLEFNLGGEMAYDKYRLRAGLSSRLKPFVSEIGQDYVLAAGLGYRANVLYVDLAYQYLIREEGYVPYFAETADQDLFIRNEVTQSKLMLTLGIKI